MQRVTSPASPRGPNFRLKNAPTVTHHGFSVPDPFAPRRRPGASFFSALLATALFRCWHILIFFAGWSTLITVLNKQGHKLSIAVTLLTVVGTVLGFVISYRTTSSFERYNEGRRLWSSIILASRTFARTVWMHIPDPPATETQSAAELRARMMIEKKTVINLLEAYSVAVKHYLRGEDGIYYQDLYYLVKFLPAYALPAGIPSAVELNSPTAGTDGNLQPEKPPLASNGTGSFLHQRTGAPSADQLPLPVTSSVPRITTNDGNVDASDDKVILPRQDEGLLFPSRMPPKYHIFDLFPFSLLVRVLTKRGKEVKGKKAARMRAKMRTNAVSHNLPLEISLYISSYISALQVRKHMDVPTTNMLLNSLNMLVDSLTGLERILTTPIPFSYSIHLWVVTVLYCLALPFQVYATMGWITIPGTIIISFVFFGFLVAGEEIENPFGYDKNDLNLDHFTNNIIRNELRAITSTAAPDPARWAFSPENDMLFAAELNSSGERVTPDQWLQRGYHQMQTALAIS
ncbi:Bestrophin, RFP-TM, chloride channel-domain-containing protein [Mycena floridula]|nr:Bestrophin, RFP-TM, chloride channel-domain-containing protein [Mycena floridula]